MQWQPIETAPKDGTRILVWSQEYGGRGPLVLFWMDEHWREPANLLSLRVPPTHWMPIPPPPTGE